MAETIVWHPLVEGRPFTLMVNGVPQGVYSRDELAALGPEYTDASRKAVISMQPEEIEAS